MRSALIAAFLALAAGNACAAEELRTLFHSPEERQRLDRLRRGEPPREAAPSPRQAPTVTGYVKRSDGRNTIWLDGRPVPMTGPASSPYTDPAKVRGTRRESAIEITPSR